MVKATWRPGRRVLAAGAVLLLLVAAGAYLVRGRGSSTGGLWVSTQGTDDGPGTAARPWRTLGHAVEVAPVGAEILVRTGTYPPFSVNRPGLKISSAPGERASIQGRSGVRDVVLVTADNVTLADLEVTGCVPKLRPDVNVDGDHGSGIRVDRTTGVTVRGVVVRDSRGVNAAGLPVGCYGILATESRDLLITSSEVYHNGAGITVARGGSGVVVEANNVHDQDVIVQNSTEKLDDFGGYGMSAMFITDKPGPIFRGNTVVRNVGPSTDYGVDGGGMEIYDAANTTISGNTFADNDGVMETGTASSGGCADNVFTGNTATGRSTANGTASATGLVLRCASNLLVQDNTFTHLEDFAFLLTDGEPFAGTIDGLQITANTVIQRADTLVYRMQFTADGSPAVSIEQNRYQAARDRFAVIDNGTETTVSFADWRARTGFDAGSTIS